MNSPILCHNSVPRNNKHFSISKDIILVHWIGDLVLNKFEKHKIEDTILTTVRRMHACDLEINPTKNSGATSEKVMTGKFWKETKFKGSCNGKFSFIYNIWISLCDRVTYSCMIYIFRIKF